MAAGHQSPRSCFLALLLPPLTVLSAAAASYETETIHPGLVVMTLPQPVSGTESFTSPTRTWACSGRRRAAASRAEAGGVLFNFLTGLVGWTSTIGPVMSVTNIGWQELVPLEHGIVLIIYAKSYKST
jgi:hypothetical protein